MGVAPYGGLLHAIERDAERIRDALPVGRIGLQAVCDVPDLDEFGRISHGARGVLEEDLLLARAHQAEEFARLGVIVGIVLAEVPGPSRAGESEERFSIFGLFLPFAETVGLVADGGAGVAVHPHLTVAVRGVRDTSRR